MLPLDILGEKQSARLGSVRNDMHSVTLDVYSCLKSLGYGSERGQERMKGNRNAMRTLNFEQFIALLSNRISRPSSGNILSPSEWSIRTFGVDLFKED